VARPGREFLCGDNNRMKTVAKYKTTILSRAYLLEGERVEGACRDLKT
jgi:hypothetical protein